MLKEQNKNNYNLTVKIIINQLQEEIAKMGLKVTPQRVAVLEMLNGNKNHPTAESIHNTLLDKYPGLSLTTVYNILAKLVEKKKIQLLNIDPHKKRFDPCMEMHDHFYCRTCGNVYDLAKEDSEKTAGMEQREKFDGHCVETVNLNLQGVCRFCTTALP